MLWLVVGLSASAPAALGAARTDANAAYVRNQLQWGALSLPLVAQLEYRAALESAATGDVDRAEQHLTSALEFAPDFPDACFAMSKLKFRHFDPDALYFFVRGVTALAHNFEAQSLFALNLLLIGALALIVAASIVLLAFALRYLPFVAHRLAEKLDRRWRAAMPRATAYLIISIPFALFPGFVSGICVLILMTWYFMTRRERLALALLLSPIILMGLFTPQLERFSAIADPASFTNLVAKSNYAPGDPDLVTAIARVDIAPLAATQHEALGMLYLRQEEYGTAAEHFLKAIALEPRDADAYINLGNVYYQNGLWNKALEGYRKAVAVDSLDAVGQFNLAQAYIKTLLMAESSKALHEASDAGIDKVRASFAAPARERLEVYPKTMSPRELWHVAALDGAANPRGFVASALEPMLGFPLRVGAWMLLAAFGLALVMTRILKPRHLAFQCSNCGELMCESCGSADRGSFVCSKCHGATAEVSSEKVVDALLRQRRQKVVVRRRRLVRMITVWLPGLRDLFYGNLAKGFTLTLMFSVSLICLASKGYVWKDWNAIDYPAAMWKWVVPASGIVLSYLFAARSKRLMEVRNYRTPDSRTRASDETPNQMQSA